MFLLLSHPATPFSFIPLSSFSLRFLSATAPCSSSLPTNFCWPRGALGFILPAVKLSLSTLRSVEEGSGLSQLLLRVTFFLFPGSLMLMVVLLSALLFLPIFSRFPPQTSFLAKPAFNPSLSFCPSLFSNMIVPLCVES